MGKYIVDFSKGSKELKNLLGGKGANLAEMSRIGLPVPPGFTITTNTCNTYYQNNKQLLPEMITEMMEEMANLETVSGKKFGDKDNPLLVSVRSGSVTSMPGMMDTILNLGLNDETVEAIADKTNNPRFAYDCYRRFIQMYSDVVMGIQKYQFDVIFERKKREKGVEQDLGLTVDDLKEIVESYKKLYLHEKRTPFPTDPKEQLIHAVEAVFNSWNNPRAIVYRKINDIPHDLGTAVNVQSMVFGNMGDRSGTGVAFTRNPSTGENKLYGEFLLNAQGEDVVAGIRTPQSIESLQHVMPVVYHQLIDIVMKLENHYQDMQDIEFTIENEQLYILQTRSGKRTINAAINIAVDLVLEGKISKEEAILRIDAKQIDQILHPQFAEQAVKRAHFISKGLAASPGTASGRVYFNSEDVVEAAEKGESAILVRVETSPEDIEGMANAEGILTSRGGITSHAAVVARGMGKCCVSGCSEINVSEHKKIFSVGKLVIKEGDFISLDGSTGCVYLGEIPKVEAGLSGNFGQFMEWVDEVRKLKVRTNADTAKDAKVAIRFGAEGIGLCRTEHMFFDEDRIPAVRKMILSKTLEERLEALNALLPMQKGDFIEIFKVMEYRPTTIRLLDPPLHEFLPKNAEDMKLLATNMGISYDEVVKRVHDLEEVNPMLGHRGCRLAITFPEIYNMQAKAIIEAAIEVKKQGIDVNPEIMIPLVGDVKELKIIKNFVVKIANELIVASGVKLNYLVGTMIEVPRAALLADEIAKEADFFSFGTNDLTQMTYGFSRDDANKFLKDYEDKHVFEKDPFMVLDQKGVGKLMKMAVQLGRQEQKLLKCGICGEHGGEPKSVAFCHSIGLDYVSCSPYRIPIAKVAAAQAAIQDQIK